MVKAYIALGANLGDAVATLKQAVALINEIPLCTVRIASSLYKTAPLETLPGHVSGGDYINAVVEIETLLTAPALLRQLQQIETIAGRERPYTNAPRTLDLDLLLYGSAHVDSTHLTVPHPRMWQRAFVLVPLAEINPQLVSAAQLDAVKVQKISRLTTSFNQSEERKL